MIRIKFGLPPPPHHGRIQGVISQIVSNCPHASLSVRASERATGIHSDLLLWAENITRIANAVSNRLLMSELVSQGTLSKL